MKSFPLFAQTTLSLKMDYDRTEIAACVCNIQTAGADKEFKKPPFKLCNNSDLLPRTNEECDSEMISSADMER